MIIMVIFFVGFKFNIGKANDLNAELRRILLRLNRAWEMQLRRVVIELIVGMRIMYTFIGDFALYPTELVSVN